MSRFGLWRAMSRPRSGPRLPRHRAALSGGRASQHLMHAHLLPPTASHTVDPDRHKEGTSIKLWTLVCCGGAFLPAKPVPAGRSTDPKAWPRICCSWARCDGQVGGRGRTVPSRHIPVANWNVDAAPGARRCGDWFAFFACYPTPALLPERLGRSCRSDSP
jgi:hypothetical protein